VGCAKLSGGVHTLKVNGELGALYPLKLIDITMKVYLEPGVRLL
jgi:hypothetical protein